MGRTAGPPTQRRQGPGREPPGSDRGPVGSASPSRRARRGPLWDDELDKDWVCGRVRRALGSLPPDQREVLVRAYFGGRTYRQVAAELTIPEGTAKSRIRLALARLHDLLEVDVTGEDMPAWI